MMHFQSVKISKGKDESQKLFLMEVHVKWIQNDKFAQNKKENIIYRFKCND